MTLPSTFRSFSRARALAGAIEEPAAPRGFAGAAGRRSGVVEEAIAVADYLPPSLVHGSIGRSLEVVTYS